MFTSLIGLAVLTSNLTLTNLSLAIAGARYRDLSQIVQNITQVLFFLTPIMWLPRLVGEDSIILLLNPIVYFLDITRTPLLGEHPTGCLI